MKHLRKTLCLSVALVAGLSAGAQTVAIDPDTKYQHIDGFGGCGMNGQWGDVYTKEKVDLLWGKGEDAMGYNIMRIRISPNESGWNSYVNPVKWAKAHGTTVFATPWTPPHRFKINAEQPWGDQTSISGNPNPDSLEVLTGCKVERMLESAKPSDHFQFLRMGYFCADSRDSKPGHLVFNRSVMLKGSYKPE